MTSDEVRRAMENIQKIEVPDGVEPSDIRKVLAKLAKRHPLLRMRLAGENRFSLDGPAIEVQSEPSSALLDIAAGEFLRVSLSGHSLEIRMHEIMGDRASCSILAGELREAIAGRTLPKAMPKREVLSLIEASSFDAERPDAQTDRAFWWYSLSRGARSVPFPRRCRALLPAGLGAAHGATAQLEATLAPGTDEATVILSLARALRTVTDSEGAVLMDRRRSLRSSGLPAIGPFVLDQPLRVTADRDDRIGQAALRRCLMAEGHTAFDSHEAASEFAASYAKWGLEPGQVLIDYGADLSQPAEAGTLHDIWVQVDPGGAAPRLRLIYDTDVLDARLAAELMAALQAELKHSAPVTVG
jgi:hypothetical protein